MDHKKLYDYGDNTEPNIETQYSGDSILTSSESIGLKCKDMYRETDEGVQLTESPMVIYDAPKIIKVKKYRLYKGQ